MSYPRIIYGEKPQAILRAIYCNDMRKCYASVLAKRANSNLSYSIKIIKYLRDHGLIDIDDKYGRIKPIQITNKGKQIIVKFNEIEDIFENGNNK